MQRKHEESVRIQRLEARIAELEQLVLRGDQGGRRSGRRWSKNSTSLAKIALVLGLLLVLYVYFQHQLRVASANAPVSPVNKITGLSQAASVSDANSFVPISKHDKGDLVRIPSKLVNGKVEPKSLSERMRLLEARVAGWQNSITDPRLAVHPKVDCKNKTGVSEHYLCFDGMNLPGDECIVYDMGIRRQPDFGREMALKYGCTVHAFDPSPVSTEDQSWIKENKLDIPNYIFHEYGAGGVDGDLELFEYNWQQVSPIRYPMYVTQPCGNGTLTDENKFTIKWETKKFVLPVKTLPTIMKELGHSHITFLKLDVEGSEYAFLEDAIDKFGCPPVTQMSIEWHHYTFDQRYGGGSSPEQNAVIAPLDLCGMRMWQRDYDDGGFPDDARYFLEAGLTLRYTTTSHMQVN
eukprot:CAMPEP_0175132808 /NCGR_PEP_ID=MMETSP0087-20121206/7276_1 /TAXON_ID=136419 /ORGANISM="Unknown Unknown, Strain D1" /LENGTH=406 /DNA_ID=CAMNT_0016415195 /DNA_START=72 /DNA_END=1292 /DNA_ORIENTATION=+